MSSTRDLVIASLSAAAGAAAAAAALRFLSPCRSSSVRPQNLSLATNGSAAEQPPKQSPFDPARREGSVLVVLPSLVVLT
jgi:dCMP deaminase